MTGPRDPAGRTVALQPGRCRGGGGGGSGIVVAGAVQSAGPGAYPDMFYGAAQWREASGAGLRCRSVKADDDSDRASSLPGEPDDASNKGQRIGSRGDARGWVGGGGGVCGGAASREPAHWGAGGWVDRGSGCGRGRLRATASHAAGRAAAPRAGTGMSRMKFQKRQRQQLWPA
jgi:hypothetical protein